jgi:OOP family OmpA-OmpF porin
MTPQQTRYAAIGAAGGAIVGGGIGCGIAAAKDYDDQTSYSIGCPIGVGAGAVIGGVIGYVMAPGPTPVPSPHFLPMPPAPPVPPPLPTTVAREKIILRGVHFDFDEAVIRDADKPLLDEAAARLKANPGVKIDVNGYTDAIGSEAYNLDLSQRRADAVVTYLQEQGIGSGQLVPRGFGKTDFVATNASAEGRAQNRRVELMPEGQ